jgi:hypothetical protein
LATAGGGWRSSSRRKHDARAGPQTRPVCFRINERLSKTVDYPAIRVGVAGAFCTMATAKDVGPSGPSLGAKADVVRTFTMKVSGAVTAEVKGKKGDEKETRLV